MLYGHNACYVNAGATRLQSLLWYVHVFLACSSAKSVSMVMQHCNTCSICRSLVSASAQLPAIRNLEHCLWNLAFQLSQNWQLTRAHL